MRDGIPSLVVELVSWRRIDESAVEVGVNGLLSVCVHLGMLEGSRSPGHQIATIEGRLTRTEVTADRGGLVTLTRALGEDVAAGDIIALVRDPWGEVVEEVQSPVEGWILAYPFLDNQAVATGDFVAFIAFPDVGGAS
jgi:predicted deacylase